MFSPFLLRPNLASSSPLLLLAPPQHPLLLPHTLPSPPSHPPIALRLHLASSHTRNGSMPPSPFAVFPPRNGAKRPRLDVASVALGLDNWSGWVALQRGLPVRGDDLPDSIGTCQKDSSGSEGAVDDATQCFCSTAVHNPSPVTDEAKTGSLVFARISQEVQTELRCVENPRNEAVLQIAGKIREAHTSAKIQKLSGFPAGEMEMNNVLAESAILRGENIEVRESRDVKKAAIGRNREYGRKRAPKSTNEKLKEPVFDQAKEDKKFMREALVEASKAELAGEVPVGAVMVSRGTVIARSHNRVEAEDDPTAHAEMLCIRKAARQLGGWRLLEATMYVTLEPCAMCAGAILQARVGTVVWGAQSTLLGADGSWVSLFPRIEEEASTRDSNGEGTWVCKPDGMFIKAPTHPFHPNIEVRQRVLPEECSGIMKRFFQKRREDKAAMKLSVYGWPTSQFPSFIFLIIRALTKALKYFRFHDVIK